MNGRPRRWRRHRPGAARQAGVSALEFAIVAPVVIVLIFAALELMLVMMADVTLEAAVARTQRESRYHWTDTRTCGGAGGAVRTSVVNGLGGWVTQPQSLSITQLAVEAPAFPPASSAILPCSDAPAGWISYRLTLERAGVLGILNRFGVSLFQLRRTLVVRNLP